MKPILSIIIPSHRRADLLAECLRSVQKHAPQNVEIIVVDDASENAIITRTALSFPNVRVVRLRRPSGFCIAANAGIATATAPTIEMLNDDTEVTAGWAEAALACFENPKVVAVAPLVLQLDPERRHDPLIDSAGDEYDPGGFATKRWNGMTASLARRASDSQVANAIRSPSSSARRAGSSQPGATPQAKLAALSPSAPGALPQAESSQPFGLKNDGIPSPTITNEPEPVWGASASAAFYRRSALLSAGGFPDDFGAYFEDVDLAHRLNRAGGITLFQPASVVWHLVSSSYGQRPSRAVLTRQSRNEERVYWRNSASVRNLPRHAAVLIGKAIRRLREGTFRPWMQGRFEAWLS